jgi:uncharacterized HAD superfamily protein
MRKLRLCIDIDNVIAQTDEVMREVISECTGGRVRLRYEEIVEFDYCLCRDVGGNVLKKEEWKSVHDRFSAPEFILKVRPFPGIQNHLEGLADRFEIHFATARLAKARKSTVEWLEAHRFPEHGLHFLSQSEKHGTLTGFYAAVEDDYNQAVAFARCGTPCYLIEHPWNRRRPSVKGVSWVKGWPELAAHLNVP